MADLWSLACVLMELAVWVSHGYKQVQEFRDARLEATKDFHNFHGGNCFHDGEKVLPVVLVWLDRLTDEKRGTDLIMEKLVDLLKEIFESDEKDRPSAKQTVTRLLRYIGDAKKKQKQGRLEKNYSGPSGPPPDPPNNDLGLASLPFPSQLARPNFVRGSSLDSPLSTTQNGHLSIPRILTNGHTSNQRHCSPVSQPLGYTNQTSMSNFKNSALGTEEADRPTTNLYNSQEPKTDHPSLNYAASTHSRSGSHQHIEPRPSAPLNRGDNPQKPQWPASKAFEWRAPLKNRRRNTFTRSLLFQQDPFLSIPFWDQWKHKLQNRDHVRVESGITLPGGYRLTDNRYSFWTTPSQCVGIGKT